MERDDAVRKVRSLLAMADHPGTSSEEAASARALAIKLRGKHGILDSDLIEHDEIGGLFEGMFDAFRWSGTVRDEVEKIWKQVDALVDRLMRDEKGKARAEAVNAVYGHLRRRLGDDTTDPGKTTLKYRRNEVLTDFYDAYLANKNKDDRRWRTKDLSPEDVAACIEYNKERSYEDVAWRIKTDGASLNKTQVAKIVAKIHNDRAYARRRAREKAAQEQPCRYCGVTGPIEREMQEPIKRRGTYHTITYKGKETTHAYWDDDTVFSAHPSCWREAHPK